jgi:organic hydroperoxide reductase OsmC/OhrA
MSNYEAKISWRRQPDERFTDGRYSRAHEWLFDGGAKVRASSSPLVVKPPFSDPTAVDPEEAFVAAISSCHMLFFLYFAGRKGLVVTRYDDAAIGVVSKIENGREAMTKVTLHPHVVFEGDKRPDGAEVDALHQASHAACYIANSVKTEITIQGQADGLR